MKKVININFHGAILPIEETAYDILKQYIESLKIYFQLEEGKDEIINDIESRIAELLNDAIKKGSTCITDDIVETVIGSIGRPEDFEKAETVNATADFDNKKADDKQAEQAVPKKMYRDERNKILGGVCSGAAHFFGVDPVIIRLLLILLVIGYGVGILLYLILWIALPAQYSLNPQLEKRKKLYRDVDEKILGGVCTGLSHYFGIPIWVIRILFILPFITIIFSHAEWGLSDIIRFSFSPGSAILYIILWLVVPEAITATEKLEMKGEKINLDNIKNTIQSDLEGFSRRADEWSKDVKKQANKWSEEVKNRSKVRTKEFKAAYDYLYPKKTIGDVLLMIIKVLAYIISGFILLVTLIALFGTGIAITAVIPYKDFILSEGWQTYFALGILIFFIWVPVIGIITYIIRKLAQIKGNGKLVRFTFISLWLIGWICLAGFIVTVRDDFKSDNKSVEENVVLSNPNVDKLIVSMPYDLKFNSRKRIVNRDGIYFIDDDSAYLQNIQLVVIQSQDNKFYTSIIKDASGPNRKAADSIAQNIQYNITQKDSILFLDKGILITPNNKFRNQHVLITIEVPIGKKIKFNSNLVNICNKNFEVRFGGKSTWDRYDDELSEKYNQDWQAGEEYIMTETGLQSISSKFSKKRLGDNQDNEDKKRRLEELQKEKEEKMKELQELQNMEKELQKVDSLPTTEPEKKPEEKTMNNTQASENKLPKDSLALIKKKNIDVLNWLSV